MSKILSTQLTGIFQKITQNEDEMIEETARLLAQASIGQGTIYFACFHTLQAVEFQALADDEFPGIQKWTPNCILSDADRVCIFTENEKDEDVLRLTRTLQEQFIPFAVIAPTKASETNELSTLAYTYIAMNTRGGIIPHPTKLGERIITPNLLAALFIYEAIKLHYIEIMSEFE